MKSNESSTQTKPTCDVCQWLMFPAPLDLLDMYMCGKTKKVLDIQLLMFNPKYRHDDCPLVKLQA